MFQLRGFTFDEESMKGYTLNYIIQEGDTFLVVGEKFTITRDGVVVGCIVEKDHSLYKGDTKVINLLKSNQLPFQVLTTLII